MDLQKRDSQSQIVAAPEFIVTAGQKASLQQGLELKFSETGESRKSFFRKLGLNFEMLLDKVERQSALIEFDFSLSRPLEGVSRISASSLQSSIWLPLDEMTEVGTIDLQIDESEKRAVLGLDQVPIIGPLFRSHRESNGSAKLKLRMKISQLGR